MKTSPYFSEENGGYSEYMDGPIQEIFCHGHLCDNKALSSKVLPSGNIDKGKGSWTNWFSEEGTAKAMCPEDTFVAQIVCGGSHCDNQCLFCVPFASDGLYTFKSTDVYCRLVLRRTKVWIVR